MAAEMVEEAYRGGKSSSGISASSVEAGGKSDNDASEATKSAVLSSKAFQSSVSTKEHCDSRATASYEDLKASYERRIAEMEVEMMQKSEASSQEAATLREEMQRGNASRRACMEEQVAAVQASERRANECRQLWDELASSRADARSFELAAQREATEHREHVRALSTELAEQRQSQTSEGDCEDAGRRTLACSLIVANRQLLAALHECEQKQMGLDPSLSQEIQKTADGLHRAATE